MRPLSFAPGRAIGDVAARALGAAKAVDWRRAAKAATKIAAHLPAPGDGPLKIAIKAAAAVGAVAGDGREAPWRVANDVVARRGGGPRIDEAGALVKLAVMPGPDGSGGWRMADQTEFTGDGAHLFEFRHPDLGVAWLASSDSNLDDAWSCAWLGRDLDVDAVAGWVWGAHGGAVRLDVDPNGRGPSGAPKLTGAPHLAGTLLYGAGAARLAELLDEHRLAARRGEGFVALLSGPPGTGKTSLGAALARDTGGRLLVAGSGVIDGHLSTLRWTERVLSPDVVLLDDIDRSLPRDIGPLLDWLSSRSRRPGAVVLTANGSLPEALTRECRVDLIVHVDLPDRAERETIMRALCAANGTHLPADVGALLDVTDGRGEAALVDAARRLRDRSPEQVAEQLRRRRAVEAKA